AGFDVTATGGAAPSGRAAPCAISWPGTSTARSSRRQLPPETARPDAKSARPFQGNEARGPGREHTFALLHEAPVEVLLGAQRFGPPRRHARVRAVVAQDPGLLVVPELRLERLDHPRPGRLVQDRERELHPAVEVARHPVCAREVDLRLAAVSEVAGPAVPERT